MITPDTNERPPRKADGIVPIALFARFETQPGSFSSEALSANGLLNLSQPLRTGDRTERFTRDARSYFTKSRVAPERLVAFIGIGIGPSRAAESDWWKSIFIEDDHPRVPEGTPEGGEFAPKDESEADDESETESGIENTSGSIAALSDLERKIARRAARRVIRARLIAAARLIAGIGADVIPIAGEAFDAFEFAQTVADFHELAEETDAAVQFVRNGPYPLNALRVSAEDEGFSSARAFQKDFLDKRFGPAGDGYDYHHIVEQGGANGKNIPADVLHSTENMIRMPRLLHEEISAAYGGRAVDYVDRELVENSKMSLREWLQTQPYDVQRATGITVMKDLGILR